MFSLALLTVAAAGLAPAKANYEQTQFAKGLENPRSLVFDHDGNLYILNSGPYVKGSMQKTKGFITKVDSSGRASVFAKDLEQAPAFLKVDPDGYLWSFSHGSGFAYCDLEKYAKNGSVIFTVGMGSGSCYAMNFDASHNLFFGMNPVGDPGTSIFKYAISSKDTGDAPRQDPFTSLDAKMSLDSAHALSFDKNGHLYALAKNTGTVFKILPDGKVETFASGFADPKLNRFPHSMQTGQDADGNEVLFISVFINMDPNGTVWKVNMKGEKTLFAQGFNQPQFIRYNRKMVFLSNTGTGDIIPGLPNWSAGTVQQIFPDGSNVTVMSGLTKPLDLALDPKGNLYVVDAGCKVGSCDANTGKVIKVQIDYEAHAPEPTWAEPTSTAVWTAVGMSFFSALVVLMGLYCYCARFRVAKFEDGHTLRNDCGMFFCLLLVLFLLIGVPVLAAHRTIQIAFITPLSCVLFFAFLFLVWRIKKNQWTWLWPADGGDIVTLDVGVDSAADLYDAPQEWQ